MLVSATLQPLECVMQKPTSQRVIQVAVPRPLPEVFDYALPDDSPVPAIGARVQVPFGRGEVIAICVANDLSDSPHALKPISTVLDNESIFDDHLMALASWLCDYYHHPLGEVLSTMLPTALRKGAALSLDEIDCYIATDLATNPETGLSRAPRQAALLAFIKERQSVLGEDITAAGYDRQLLRALVDKGFVCRHQPTPKHHAESPLEATSEQAVVIASVIKNWGQFNVGLLEGVTGSGKTEVYLQLIAHALAQGGQALVLIPEISLTPQTLERFERRFDEVGMLHSELTDRQRLQTWMHVAQGNVRVLIGTRSAVFSRFHNLSLIIVDEEHDSSYKQQDGLRYSARDVAAKRAHQLGIPLLLGSATPALESLNNVALGRYAHFNLPNRAGGARLPDYHLIDMRGEKTEAGLSHPLIAVMRKHIQAGGQVLIYLNRRGFAPVLLCNQCGWQAKCSACDARLTLHRSPPHLLCHHCTLQFPNPQHCPSCGNGTLLAVGQGTQRAEEAIHLLFKEVPVYRVDRDNLRSRSSFQEQLDRIHSGDPCILVGTQLLAKGHHFPGVTLVGIIDADSGLLSSDFRAPERTAQIIVQVAGRSGRAEKPGEVWIQTLQPDNPVLKKLLTEGYQEFAKAELQSRQSAELPPFAAMAIIRSEAHDKQLAMDFLTQCKTHLENTRTQQNLAGTMLLGPVAAPIAKVANRFRFQLMLNAPQRAHLHRWLKTLQPERLPRGLRWSIDVDPYDAF